MDSPPAIAAKPALLMRRVTAPAAPVPTLSRNSSDPLMRVQIEAGRGSATLQLAAGAENVMIQWTQNGTPIRGQTGTSILFSGLVPDDTDVYFALLRSASGESRSQAVQLVVTPGNPLLNFSARGQVTAERPLIAGFVVGKSATPAKPKQYLIRAVSASLKKFGVTETVSRPQATLHRGSARVNFLPEAEQNAIARKWAPKVGAFSLEQDGTEFVGVAELAPGPYSLIATTAGGEAGQILAEIYELPA